MFLATIYAALNKWAWALEGQSVQKIKWANVESGEDGVILRFNIKWGPTSEWTIMTSTKWKHLCNKNYKTKAYI